MKQVTALATVAIYSRASILAPIPRLYFKAGSVAICYDPTPTWMQIKSMNGVEIPITTPQFILARWYVKVEDIVIPPPPPVVGGESLGEFAIAIEDERLYVDGKFITRLVGRTAMKVYPSGAEIIKG